MWLDKLKGNIDNFVRIVCNFCISGLTNSFLKWKMCNLYMKNENNIYASDFNHFTTNSVVLLSCSIDRAELNVLYANYKYWIRHSMLISYTSSWILLRTFFISISNFEFCLNWLKHFSSSCDLSTFGRKHMLSNAAENVSSHYWYNQYSQTALLRTIYMRLPRVKVIMSNTPAEMRSITSNQCARVTIDVSENHEKNEECSIFSWIGCWLYCVVFSCIQLQTITSCTSSNKSMESSLSIKFWISFRICNVILTVVRYFLCKIKSFLLKCSFQWRVYTLISS